MTSYETSNAEKQYLDFSVYKSMEEDKNRFDFFGKHILASYSGCNVEALRDTPTLLRNLGVAIESSGATILKYSIHEFEGGGLTAIFLLSESHASIHTYPEHASCFLDMFTCGDNCKPDFFDVHMRQYLNPEHHHSRILVRSRFIEDWRDEKTITLNPSEL